MMNVKNMFVFAIAFFLLSFTTTSTDGLSLKRVVTTSTNVVNARLVRINDVELSTPSVVRGEPVSVARVVQDPSAQVPVEGVPVEGVPDEGVPVEGVPLPVAVGRRAQSLSGVLDDILPNRSSSSSGSRRRPTFGEVPVIDGEVVSSTTPQSRQGPVSRRVKNLFGRLSLNRSSSGSRPRPTFGERSRGQIKRWLRRNHEAVAIVIFLVMVGVMVGVGFIVKKYNHDNRHGY